jgi:hypothetical protein
MLSKEKLEIYKKADILFKKYNPCDFKNGICIARRNSPVMSQCSTFQTSCCRCGFECDEKNFHNGKCLIKSLACKLYFCYDVDYKIEFRHQLESLIQYAQKLYNNNLWANLYKEQ